MSYDIDDKQLMVKNVILYILNNINRKYPIKRIDIINNALNGSKNSFKEVFESVKSNLLEIYGINVYEVPEVKIPQYICVATSSAKSILEYTTHQNRQNSILFIVLGYILMLGDSVNEDAVLNILNKINKPEKETMDSSTLETLIKDTFVKQLYLKREKFVEESTRTPSFILSWGFRSTLEYSKKDVFLKTVEIMNEEPSHFTVQYYSIFGNENEDVGIEMLE